MCRWGRLLLAYIHHCMGYPPLVCNYCIDPPHSECWVLEGASRPPRMSHTIKQDGSACNRHHVMRRLRENTLLQVLSVQTQALPWTPTTVQRNNYLLF